MNKTLGEFAYEAARDLGCIRAGQTLGTDLLNDIKTAANEMLEAWLIDDLVVPASPAQIYAMTAGQQRYQIGPGAVPAVVDGVQFGAFDGVRPIDIQDANIVLNTVSPVLRTPLELINVDQWADIRVQDLPYALPLRLYYVANYDTTTGWAQMLFWPGPLNAYSFELYTGDQQVLRQFTDLTTAYKYPPAYARLIRKKLAVEIIPLMVMYCKAARMEPGSLLLPTEAAVSVVKAQADEAYQKVTSENADDPILVGDPAFRSSGQASGWNYMLGVNQRRGR